MTLVRAIVKGGRLLVDEPTDLPEGTELELLPVDDMDDGERAALMASIGRGLAQVDRGEGVPAEEALRRLRASK
jgi:hypothetical protein